MLFRLAFAFEPLRSRCT